MSWFNYWLALNPCKKGYFLIVSRFSVLHFLIFFFIFFHVTFTLIAQNFMLCCRLMYILSIPCVRLTIKVKVGIPESCKVGWYPSKKLGQVTLKWLFSFETWWINVNWPWKNGEIYRIIVLPYRRIISDFLSHPIRRPALCTLSSRIPHHLSCFF